MIDSPKDSIINEDNEAMVAIKKYCNKIKPEHVVVTPEPDMSNYVHMDLIQVLTRLDRDKKPDNIQYFWS